MSEKNCTGSLWLPRNLSKNLSIACIPSARGRAHYSRVSLAREDARTTRVYPLAREDARTTRVYPLAREDARTTKSYHHFCYL